MNRLMLSMVLMLTGICAFAQSSVTGTVMDAAGNPLPGAYVLLKGTQTGTNTDLDGKYSIQVPSPEAVLVFSSLSYLSQEITVGRQSVINVTLQDDTKLLDQVVVVGYGTQKKVNLTGAVATVDTQIMKDRPVTSLTESLQGSVAGLSITRPTSGGELGGAMNVNIRGTGTISSGSKAEVLVLIDGLEGNISNVNPNDIENISVLKDAAAASIYGSRAAFGVILITTKRGQTGKVQVSYGNSFRYSGPTRLPDVADSYSFAQYFNETALNEGSVAVFNQETLDRIQAYQRGEITTTTIENTGNGNWQFHTQANDNINWYEKQFQWAWAQDHNLNLRGGNENLLYFASVSYLDQNGNLRFGEDKYNRFTATLKVDAKINKYIDFNVDAKYIRYKLDNPLYTALGGLLYHDILRMWPTMPYLDPNGHYMRNGKLAQLTNGSRSLTNNDNLYGKAQVVLHPAKGWNITAEAGARIINQNTKQNLNQVLEYNVKEEPLTLAYGGSYVAGQTMAAVNFLNSNQFTYNVFTDYTLDRNGHYFKVLGGFNAENYVNRRLGASRDNLITEAVPEINAATGDDKITESNIGDWSTAGVFGRLNYDYKGRYLIEVNARYDASSRFLAQDRWGLFYSGSMGWNIAKEPFFEKIAQATTITTLKPRVSWGSLGNQNTNSFYPMYLTQDVKAGAGTWLIGGVNPNVASVPGVVSSTLTWETVESTNIGLDLAMLDNRLEAEFNWYSRTTKDMVGPASEIGAVYGTSMPSTNNAVLRNKGWELALNWRDQIGDFAYGVGFNLYDSRTTVLSYPNASKSLNTYYDGMEMGNIWGYTTHGIAKSQDEMNAWLADNKPSWGSNWQEGDIMFQDLNGDKIINKGSQTLDDHGDLSLIGNKTPRFNFGLNLSAAFKGFDLSIFLQGVMKRDLWLAGPYFWGAGSGQWQMTCFTEHLDYYRPENTTSVFGPNTDAYFPKAYMGSGKNQETQTRYLQNGAYMRVKNAQLGYTLPQNVTNKLGIGSLRLYVSAENPWTLTSLPASYDPEATDSNYSGAGTGKTYPLSTTVSFGLNLNF